MGGKVAQEGGALARRGRWKGGEFGGGYFDNWGTGINLDQEDFLLNSGALTVEPL